MFPMKYVFMVSYLIFAVGSAVSASATSSPAFIVGRAVSGLGSAGVFSGGSMLACPAPLAKYVADVCTVYFHERPLLSIGRRFRECPEGWNVSRWRLGPSFPEP